MPNPSSLTRTRRRPPSSISMSTVVAPASSAFSRSSLTTEAGRSTTSPAAIWSATSLDSIAMRGTYAPPSLCRCSFRDAERDLDLLQRLDTLCFYPAAALVAQFHVHPGALLADHPHHLARLRLDARFGRKNRHWAQSRR